MGNGFSYTNDRPAASGASFHYVGRETEAAEQAQAAEKVKRSEAMRLPLSGMVGAASHPEDIPGLVGSGINALTGVKQAINNPIRTAAFGPVGSNAVQGANLLSDRLNLPDIGMHLPRIKDELGIYPESVTRDGRIAGTAMELSLPIAMGKINSKPIPKFQTSAEINAQIGELESAGRLNQKYLTGKESDSVASIKNATRSVIDNIDSTLNTAQSRFANNSRDAVLQSRGKATQWVKNEYKKFDGLFQGAAKGVEIPHEDARSIIDSVEAQLPYVSDADKAFLTSLKSKLSGPAPLEAPTVELMIGEKGPMWQTSTPKAAEVKTISAQKLLNELTPGNYKAGPYTTVDHIKGVAKDALIDYLAGQGNTDMATVRAQYGPFAKFRNKIFNVLQPYAKAGEYDTAKAVKTLRDAAAGKGPDGIAFLEAYSQVDPELAALVNEHSKVVKGLSSAKIQAAKRAEAETQSIRTSIAKKRFEIAEHADEKIQRLTREMQTAATAEGRMKAQHELNKWLGRIAIGVGSYAVGRQVTKSLPSD